MTLTSPLWLLVALAAVAVVLLHALQRTRVEVPSLLLWSRIAGSARARVKPRLPRPNWLLALQILAVLLLALALARPLWGQSDEPGHRIYLLDVSASMSTMDGAEGQSRLQTAIAAIASDVAALDATADIHLSLLAVGSTAEPLAARWDDRAAFLALLSATEPRYGIADWTGAGSLIASIRQSGEVTALQLHTDQADGAAALGSDAVLRTYGQPDTANAGLVASVGAGEQDGEWLAEGRVTLIGAVTVEQVALRFQPVGGASFLDLGTIVPNPAREADGVMVATFSTTIRLPGPGVLQLALPEDAATFDNVSTHIVGSANARLRALYIGQGNRTVEAALMVNPAVELFSTQDLPPDVDDYDLVLVENVALPRVPRTNVVWLGSARGPGVDAPTFSAAAPILGWNEAHDLTAGLSWQALEAVPAYGFAPLPESAALLTTAAGPAVEARTTAFGREVRIALAFGDADWTAGPQLPLLLRRVLDWTGAMPAPVSQCVSGQPCAIPARLLNQDIHDDRGNIFWRAPAAAEGSLPDALTESFVPTRPGLYTMGTDHQFAVNAPVTESAITATLAEPAATVSSPPTLWRWVILATLAVLILEAAIAGRGREGFLTPIALANGFPGSRRRRWLLGARVLAIASLVVALLTLPLPLLGRTSDQVVVVPLTAETCATLAGQTVVSSGRHPAALGGDACASSGYSTAVDLEGAVRLAVAMVRPQANGRIVIADDRAETLGAVGQALPLFGDRDIALDLLSSPPVQFLGGIAVAALHAPQPVFAGDSVPIAATLVADEAGSQDVAVVVDGVEIETRTVALAAGANRVDLVIPEISEGEHDIELHLAGRTEPNARGLVALTVQPSPRIAVVTPDAAWGTYLVQALEVHGLKGEVLRPDRAPFRMDGWLGFDGVVLLNTPAIDLTTVQQDLLEQYVRIHGGGLLILGGENSFGPGGYFQTPLETVSPLSARVPNDLPVAALAFVLDRSGSMQAQVDGVSRLEIAKEATASAVGLLNDESQVSVIVFDTETHVVAPMQRKNIAAVETALAPLQPGGGTYFMPALEEALRQLDVADAPVRHIILMSDGLSQPGDYEGFAARAKASGITLSVVAIGDSADVGRLGAIARNGGGAFHSTTDFRALPSILSQEAMMLAGKPMEEGVQAAYWRDRAARFLAGTLADLPPVQGYVETTVKPDAAVHAEVVNAEGETAPLMASWAYGNGQVLAFATHGAGPGTAQWLPLPDYPLLWAQVLRHFAQDADTLPQLLAHRRGDAIVVTLAGLDDGVVTVTGPDGIEVPVALVPSADGKRTGTVYAAPGVHAVQAQAGEVELTARVAISYPAALEPLRTPTPLTAFSAASGGRVLVGALPSWPMRLVWQPAWRPWLLLGLILFLLDLTMRYAPGYFGFLADPVRRASRQDNRPGVAACREKVESL